MNPRDRLRTRVHLIIFGTNTPTGKAFDMVLLVLIAASVVVVMLESVDVIGESNKQIFYTLEWIFTILFSIEYLLRLYVARRPLKYMLSFFGLVDLLSIIPTYLSLFVVGSKYLMTIRALRLLRIFRILKLARFTNESRVLAVALVNARHKIFIFLGAVMTIVIIIGSLMYILEGGQSSGFTSIPRSMYWAIVTITTVGYGDITPVTNLGQFMSAILMLTGYSIIAVPTGIVSVEIAKARSKDSDDDADFEAEIYEEYDENRSSDAVLKRSVGVRFCEECGSKILNTKAIFCAHCGNELFIESHEPNEPNEQKGKH